MSSSTQTPLLKQSSLKSMMAPLASSSSPCHASSQFIPAGTIRPWKGRIPAFISSRAMHSTAMSPSPLQVAVAYDRIMSTSASSS